MPLQRDLSYSRKLVRLLKDKGFIKDSHAYYKSPV